MALTKVSKDISNIPSKIQSITATQSSGALTFGIASTSLDYRSTTLTTGATTTITNGTLSLTLASGGTLGFVSAVQGRIAQVVINNAGTAELAIINLSGGNSLDETGLISTTAISATATGNNVFYSTTARTSVAYRVVGFLDAVNTAGAWATPVLVQGTGGQALASLSSLGYGQIYASASITSGTTNYNTSGKPIAFAITAINVSNTNANVTLSLNGGAVFGVVSTGGGSSGQVGGSSYVIIPVNNSYVFTHSNTASVNYTRIG